MNLEEEIKQEKFRSEAQKVAINLTFTHFWLMDRMKKHLKPYGISLQQFNILRILRGQHPKPASVSLLKERMLDKSSDASRLVERLRVKGYILRDECPHDRRAVDICIADKGLELLKKIDKISPEFDNMLSPLNEEEQRQLNDLLDKLRADK